MKRTACLLALLSLLPLTPFPGRAWAETIELVTYYPASGGSGDLHVRSLTVGTDYEDVTPADGTAILSGLLGIGTETPQVDLDIYREDEAYIRVSGTGIAATPENFSGIELGADLPAGGPIDRTWQIVHKRGGSGAGPNDLHINYFDGTDWNNRLAIRPEGHVGIGSYPVTANGDVGKILNIHNSDLDKPNVTLVGSNTSTEPVYAPLILEGFSRAVTAGDPRVAQIHLARGNNSTTALDGYIGFWTTNGGLMNEKIRLTSAGNLGVGTEIPQTTSPTNSAATGNIDANDVYLRSINGWASQLNAVAKMYGVSGQTVPSEIVTIVDFGSGGDNFDSAGMTDPAGNRFVIPADGVYQISTSWGHPATYFTLWTIVQLTRGSTTWIAAWFSAHGSDVGCQVAGSELFQLQQGDIVRMGIWQNSGGPIGTQGIINSPNNWDVRPRMSVHRIR